MLSVYSILSPAGVWGCADLWAGPAGPGSSGCVWLGSATLWAHGPSPQPLYHRAVCLQGGCFLLLCQLGCSAAVRQSGSQACVQPCVLPCHRDGKEASPWCQAHIWGSISVILHGAVLCLFPGSCSSPSPSPSTWDPAACPSVPGPMPQGSPWSHLSPPCALSRYHCSHTAQHAACGLLWGPGRVKGNLVVLGWSWLLGAEEVGESWGSTKAMEALETYARRCLGQHRGP